MTRTPLLLALVASAALAGCDSNNTIVVGPDGIEDPNNTAAVNVANVQLPPSIAASKTYRCRDNSVVHVDWLSDNKSANFRGGDADVPVQLTAAQPGGPLTAEGYSLTGDASAASITITAPDKGTRNCHV